MVQAASGLQALSEVQAVAKRTPTAALYVQGIFDVTNPNNTQLAQLRRYARKIASSGATCIIQSFIHVRSDATIVYNNDVIVYGKACEEYTYGAD